MSDGSPIRSLSADIAALEDELEHGLESVLNHPCHVEIEEYDSDTGEVTVRAEPDLAQLRERLRDVCGYDGVHIGIDGHLTLQLSPKHD